MGFILMPPSILYSPPVMNEASSEAKNVTSFAISSGCPKRFNGILFCIAAANSFNCSSCMPVLPKIGVYVGPGFTEFTRIFLGESSVAAVLVYEFNAA